MEKNNEEKRTTVWSSVKCPHCGGYYPVGSRSTIGIVCRLDGAREYRCRECGKIFYHKGKTRKIW